MMFLRFKEIEETIKETSLSTQTIFFKTENLQSQLKIQKQITNLDKISVTNMTQYR